MATSYDETEDDCPLDEKLGEPATFHFPDSCCRCLAASPAEHWKIASAKNVEGTNLSVTYSVAVPICGDCRSQLMRSRYVVGTLTGLFALAAAAAFWLYDPFESRQAVAKDMAMIWSLTGLVLFGASVGAFYLIGLVFVPRRLWDVAYLNRDGNKVIFYNPEYQRQYANYFPPAEPADSLYAAVGDEKARW